MASCREAYAVLNETAALLIGVVPSERDYIEEIAQTLEECGRTPEFFGTARDEVEALAQLLRHVLEVSEQEAQRLLTEAVAAIERALDLLGREQGDPPTTRRDRHPGPPGWGAVTSPSASQADSQPGIENDPTLLAEFVSEAIEHLEGAEAALLALESSPNNRELINTVFRAFHTIKSTSGFLGFEPLKLLAHAAEELLDRARNGTLSLSGRHADVVLLCCDTLKSVVGGLRSSPAIGPSSRSAIENALAKLGASDVGTSTPTAVAPQAGTPPAGADGGAPETARALASPDASVRVNRERLDALVNLVGELVVAQSMVINDPVLRDGRLERLAHNAALAHKILKRLQDLTMSLSMVSLRPTFQRMTRLVRDLGHKSGKRIELETQGEDTEIDRNMVEHLGDPLIHMIRNAVDHGLESAEERRAAGKPEAGRLSLKAYHAAGNVVIELADDGRGLDLDAILAKAHASGIVPATADLDDGEIQRLIFLPGLSTASEVTEVSGRGVGMDVVKRGIEALRGRVEVQSHRGAGTTFVVRLPLTMAIIDAMLVRAGAQRFLLPTVAIVESIKPERGSITSIAGRGEVASLRGELLRVLRLGDLVGAPDAQSDPYASLLVIIDSGHGRCALQLDELIGQQQVVIKSLDRSLGEGFGQQVGVAGAAILGDGRVGLILDASLLVEVANRKDPSRPTGSAAPRSGGDATRGSSTMQTAAAPQ